MGATGTQKTSRDKVRAHRARLRQLGMRPVQVWVPDVRSDQFRAAAHEQSVAVARTTHAQDDQAFVDSISDWPDA